MPTLKEVVRLCPGHASAAAMLKTLSGHAVNTLSLYTSLDELDRYTEAALEELRSKGTISTNDVQGLAAAAANLDTMRPRLDYRTVDLCNARVAMMRAAAAVYGQRQAALRSVLYGELSRCVHAVDEVERRMASDPALAEALRH